METTILPVHPTFGTALGVRRNGAPIWPVRGASQEGDPPSTAPEPTTTPQPATTEPKAPAEPAADDGLGDGGKKALEAERLARKEAEKAQKAAEAKVKTFEDAQKSDAQKQAERLAELETEAATAKHEALRFKYAAKHQLSDEDAETFLTGADEATIAKQAARLAELVAGGATPKPQPGTYVPGEGRTPQTPNLDEQIAEAQKNRDFTRAIALKEQRSAQQRQAR
ncbi:hypothetical protein [Nocardia sp. NBC_01009]|uniref:hypothetical protein n=1 Tax=Nocardia sp. NBC_01009 TaxID=2975996 RepID=UPI0038686AD6|nr:hypothetical protein OHA42_04980 [Nocardia sp. NBC_01009]